METKDTLPIEAFLQLLEEQVGKGIYVWGGNGELLTEMPDPKAWIERHEQNAADAKRAIALYEKRIAKGEKDVRAFDCSGLVYWALKSVGVQKTDVSSRGLYVLCTPLASGKERAGDLVFHHDGTRIVHVGVCVGAEQIECRGRDEGVVKSRRKRGYWNRVGRFKAFESSEQTASVHILGGSVRVREGDHKGTRCIGVAHRGERYPLLGIAPSGWYRISYRGQSCCITNRARYTEVRYG